MPSCTHLWRTGSGAARHRTDHPISARKKVLLSGYYGFGNAGDEAVCAAVLQTLRSHAGNPDVMILSGNPEESERSHGVRAVRRNKILDALPRVDALIQGGGSLLQDTTSAASVFYYLWVIMAARIIRRPVFLYAQGIGPLRRPVVRAAVKTVLNRVQSITVRDKASKLLLEELGVRKPSIYLTADPVWALEPAPDERAKLIWERQGLPAKGSTVTIAVREWAAAPQLASIVSRGATLLQGNGLDPVFLPMQRPNDEEMASTISLSMPKPAPVLRGGYAPGDMMALAGRTDFLVGMRLHALIFAAARGVPVIGLPYDPKVSALLEEIGAPSAASVKDLTPETMVQAVMDAWEHRDTLRVKVAREAERLRDNALGTGRLAKAFLDGI